MGKWATYAKRGSVGSPGIMSAPEDGEWTFTSPSPNVLNFTRLISPPAPATKYGARYRTALGAWINRTPGVGTPDVVASVGGTQYWAQLAWFAQDGTQLSPWSNVKTVVSL